LQGINIKPDQLDLSVIIVNYNVKHFLEQCLYSVRKACNGLQAEILVIDNRSSDGSLAYLQPAFPDVQFIANKDNAGFGKACNQGLAISKGKYILFLNPDTIVPEDCFLQCRDFMESHPDAGALGIRMLDGSGRFLKESKRSFPSPLTSLFKLAGLTSLFPRSRVFARYHLGHLDEKTDHEVDVLAGAFMWIRKSVLDKTGGFDEAFFMYGEDVDLSYRIQEAGFRNYYFAGSEILHFKGESTKKGSMNYVRMFYQAMSIFVRKHYGGGKAGLFNVFIHLAIWMRAVLAAIGSFIKKAGLPLIDLALIIGSFWIVKTIWSGYVRPDIQYSSQLLWIAFPAFAFFYLVAAYYAGLYDRRYHRSELISSTLLATLILLAGYSLLPEQYRFSRGIILFGALLGFLLLTVLRRILVRMEVLQETRKEEEHITTVVAGSPREYTETLQLMKQAGLQERVLGRVGIMQQENGAIGYWKDLVSLRKMVPFREIIYCEGTLTFKEIVNQLSAQPAHVKMKLRAAGSRSIVGSHSKDDAGEALSGENGFALNDPHNRRLKRLIDFGVAFMALLTFPLQLILVKKPLTFLYRCLQVLCARKTWIGYAGGGAGLPVLRPAIIASNGLSVLTQQLTAESLQMVDYWYARDYRPLQDLRLLWRSYRRLGS
jgi:GT2 family glycosyltransferase